MQTTTTLAGLEERFRDAPKAAQYIRTLRLARFADGTDLPGPELRTALRKRLADGLGSSGTVRSLWALPPRVRVGRREPAQPA